jgi:large subunit ribosomal protein L9
MPKKSDSRVSIILTKTLRKNAPGSVVKVRKGYANYLMQFANQAVYLKGNEDIIEKKKQEWLQADSKQQEENAKIMKALEGFQMIIKRRSGIGGAIYGSVSARDISKEIEDKLAEMGEKIKFQSNNIKINPIKVLGDYTAKVEIGDAEIKLPVSVVGA